MPLTAAQPPSNTAVRWRVQLLGGLSAQQGDRRLTHFGNRNAALLLARLAMYPQRSHAREELIELLWPGVALEPGRNRLRQALFTLRRLLEPPSSVSAPVLEADRSSLRVVPGTLGCDVLDFERALRSGLSAQARELYRGDLLPGFYDGWIADERLRLAALADRLGAAPMVPQHDAGFAPGSTDAVAAPPSAAAIPLLPSYLTRFFGRDNEGARLRAELQSHRLVTLLGPGGSGKTRLAVELATELRADAAAGPRGAADDRFDLVAFVPLVGCSTRAQLLDALLAVLPSTGHVAEPLAQACAALAGRRCLLVLDNFEQLVGSGEAAVAELARAAPQLHLLVTSRRLLGLDGEREFALAPLPLPANDIALHEAAINPAVALFVDRARAARANFHISAGNRASLVGLARLLEGMPLALELAASRIRSLSPADMLALLQRDAGAAADLGSAPQLALLARGAPRAGLDPRHASMQRTIEWSWQMLDAEPARLLAMLTVFHGGCSAAAAAAVAERPLLDTHLLLDALVSHSLLHRPANDDEGEPNVTRFSIYEPIREFAASRLAAADAHQARARQRAWLIGWGRGFGAMPPLRELRLEMPNVIAALNSALADDLPSDALELALALRRALHEVELPAHGLTLIAHAIERCRDVPLQSRGDTLIGPLLFSAGRSAEALRHAERGLANVPRDDPLQRARALHSLAHVRWGVGRHPDGVADLLAEALTLAEATGDLEAQAGVHTLRAYITDVFHRDPRASEAQHGLALALWQRLGNRYAVNNGHYYLAACEQRTGRNLHALERLERVIDEARAMHDWHRLSQALNLRGIALSNLRRWPAAVATYRDCIRLAWDCMAPHDLAFGLWNLPRALARSRAPADALRVAAFAADFWESRFGPLTAGDQRFLLRVRRLAARQADAADCRRWWSQGTRLTLPDAVRLALGDTP